MSGFSCTAESIHTPSHGRLSPMTQVQTKTHKTIQFQLLSFETKAISRKWIIPLLQHEVTCTKNYYSITPRTFDMIDNFPIISPIVSFTGPIIGSGLTLLRDSPLSGLSEAQRKYCGFVQLSTFITPRNSNKPPFRGFHQFQVFIIFPIHANPWTLLCKKMVERQDTQFQPNTGFTCTGKVAGFLAHHTMVQPPQLKQDYVFIVVPDTWTFLDKMSQAFTSTSPLSASLTKQTSTLPSTRSKFLSPSKRTAEQASNQASPISCKTLHVMFHPSILI